MKSKQINFFILPDDLKEIDKFLKEKGCLIIKRRIENLKYITDYDIISNTEDVFQVYLYRVDYKSKLKFEHVDSKDYHFVDILKSYSIEFSMGGFYPYSQKELHRSRFYFITEYYDNDGVTVRKDAEFIAWGDNIFKNFKKQFLKKAPELANDFFSERCIEWAKQNHAKPREGGVKLVIN